MSVHTKKSDTHEERYYHVPITGSPRVYKATVYMREVAPGTWHAQAAYCAYGDQFSRRIGRQTARRKFFSDKMQTGMAFDRVKAPTYDEALRVVLQGLPV